MSDPTIEISLDARSRAAYLRLSGSAVGRTHQVQPELMLDTDQAGDAVGIEILSMQAFEFFIANQQDLSRRFHLRQLSPEDLETVRAFFEEKKAS